MASYRKSNAAHRKLLKRAIAKGDKVKQHYHSDIIRYQDLMGFKAPLDIKKDIFNDNKERFG